MHGGLQHQDLMDHFEVSRGTVSRWCRDVGTPPKKFVLNEIAVMCGVSPRWLIDGSSGPGDDGGGAVSPGPTSGKSSCFKNAGHHGHLRLHPGLAA